MYEIYHDNELVGMGLSPGETNQWIIDLASELKGDELYSFKKAFGFSKGNFEDFLYDNEIVSPISMLFNGKELLIKEQL